MFGTPIHALWAARHYKAPFMAVVYQNRSYSTGTLRINSRLWREGQLRRQGRLRRRLFRSADRLRQGGRGRRRLWRERHRLGADRRRAAARAQGASARKASRRSSRSGWRSCCRRTAIGRGSAQKRLEKGSIRASDFTEHHGMFRRDRDGMLRAATFCIWPRPQSRFRRCRGSAARRPIRPDQSPSSCRSPRAARPIARPHPGRRLKVSLEPDRGHRECLRRRRQHRRRQVARAPPDGYTISIGHVQTHVLNGAVYNLAYDVLNDFDPIALIADVPDLSPAPRPCRPMISRDSSLG